ncbi:Nucleoside-diphosphate-sugar epimerase [Candidatus Desulfarcum epimagneticum]|uniref:Nucleoside-diphosphate-sugar epimerase n=1 Tax=uncultured Desulfobacteraceae bacterium TaxID=218296 RepID=A0A484HKR8_9BACT|nr:Nucleoside-diphosphate-sugar epimerase [uncultured Desulfobacteraceae bacterium]
MTKKNRKLRIASVLDGTPGHEKQTLAVIGALSRRVETDVARVRVRKKSAFQTVKSFLLLAAGRFSPPGGLKGRAFPDIIIGTGSSTHLPMLHLKGKSRAKAVTCMTPDFFIRKKMDLCLVPAHDGTRPGKNIFFTQGPPCGPGLSGKHDKGRGLVLVGGTDPKSHVWDSGDVLRRIENIFEKEPHVRWTVSSSPRTPAETEEGLAALAGRFENAVFFSWKDTPRGWVERVCAESFRAWITADSVSMAYEALAAGCRLGIIPVKWKKRSSKIQKSVDGLLEGGLADSCEAWLSGTLPPENIPAGNIPDRAPGALNEAGRCAEEILRRWGRGS